MRNKVTLQVNGQDFTLGQQTWIMGILNVTPDSFSDGNIYFDRDNAVKHGLDLVKEGADILDVGGESSGLVLTVYPLRRNCAAFYRSSPNFGKTQTLFFLSTPQKRKWHAELLMPGQI